MKLSAAIATLNEEINIAGCLDSIKDLVDEIVIVDGNSTDKTREIAQSYRAKVIIAENKPNFHFNKQQSFDEAKGEWILYLDADERVSKKLADEIRKVINFNNQETEEYQKNIKNKALLLKHQRLLEERDGKIGINEGEYTAFFFPRLNFFLGRALRYGGVYPDGVIRLFKKDKAYLPCKSVHEQMVVLGKVGWLENDLIHIDSPNFNRYIERNNRYVKLLAAEYKEQKIKKSLVNILYYCFYKPIYWFFLTQIRHKGILDGFPGIIFSFFSALRFPKAYLQHYFNRL